MGVSSTVMETRTDVEGISLPREVNQGHIVADFPLFDDPNIARLL